MAKNNSTKPPVFTEEEFKKALDEALQNSVNISIVNFVLNAMEQNYVQLLNFTGEFTREDMDYSLAVAKRILIYKSKKK